MMKTRKPGLIDNLLQLTMLLLFTLLVTFLMSILLSPVTGENGLFLSFITKPFSSRLAFGNLLGTFTILLLCGLAMMIPLKAGFFNLGGEGQIYLGGFAVAVFLLKAGNLPSGWGILFAVLIGGFAGMIPSIITALLKVFGDVNEMISSYILSLTTVSTVHYLITNRFNDPSEYLIATTPIDQRFFLHSFLPPSSLNWFIIPALFFVIMAALFFEYFPSGRKSVLLGKNPVFCRFSGMNTGKYTFILLSAGGFLFGVAGAVMVLGLHHRAIRSFSEGFGWNGILVALLAGGNPLMMIGSAFFMSWISEGTKAFTLRASLPFDFSLIVEGLLLLVLSSKGPSSFSGGFSAVNLLQKLRKKTVRKNKK